VEAGWLMMVKVAPTAFSDQQNLARSKQGPTTRLPLSGNLIDRQSAEFVQRPRPPKVHRCCLVRNRSWGCRMPSCGRKPGPTLYGFS